MVSVATAVVMLFVVRLTTKPAKIDRAKRAVQADLLEMRLFADDLPAMLRAALDVLRQQGRYLGLMLVPLLWMIVPILLLSAQLEAYFGYTGIDVGHATLLKVTLGSGQPGAPALDAPNGVRVDTPAVWFPLTREIVWRITPERPGPYDLAVRVDGATFVKTLHVGSGTARRSPTRVADGLLSQLFSPSEPPLPRGAAVESIRVDYPPSEFHLLGLHLDWVILFLAMTLTSALILRRPFGVTI